MLNKPSDEPETFKHMLTAVMIMFQDAKDLENENTKEKDDRAHDLTKQAFDYAESWLEAYTIPAPRKANQ